MSKSELRIRAAAKSALLNPFSPARAASDAALLNETSSATFEEAVAVVRETLASTKRPNVDRATCAQAALFVAYHEHENGMAAFLENGDASGGIAEFACRMHEDLTEAFGDSDRAAKWVAIAYQAKRAHTHISRTLIGGSVSLAALRAQLWQSLFTHDIHRYEERMTTRLLDFSTFLVGETGTGKSVAARALGLSAYIPFDPRKKRFTQKCASMFVEGNLAEYPESLLEGELFGYEKGAFTGASRKHQGLFERTPSGGSLFLDEIADLGAHVQTKLLRVLQNRSYQPLGSATPQHFAGRVIAASNRNAEELLATGRMRADLFFRISTQQLQLPSLRERVTDNCDELRTLITAFCERILGVHDEEARAQVQREVDRHYPTTYAWPGNLRELEQVVRLTLLTGSASPSRELANAMTLPVDEQARRLFAEHANYSVVGRLLGVDRRTVRKWVTQV